MNTAFFSQIKKGIGHLTAEALETARELRSIHEVSTILVRRDEDAGSA
jgi:hypothetical protein